MPFIRAVAVVAFAVLLIAAPLRGQSTSADPPPEPTYLQMLASAAARDVPMLMGATTQPDDQQWRPSGQGDAATPFDPSVTGPPGQQEYESDEVRMYSHPGPELAGWRDLEMIYWMNFERLRNTDYEVNYGYRRYCEADVAGQRRDFGFTQHDFVARTQTSGGSYSSATAYAKVRTLDMHARPLLPTTGGHLFEHLTDVQIGAMFPWIYPPGEWNVTLGSASDRPFNSWDEVTADVTWAIGSLDASDHSYIFYINYSNNRDWLNRVPMPGFVYRYRHSDDFMLVTGFPYQAFAWRPSCPGNVVLSATWAWPRTVYSRITWQPLDELELFAGFEWTNQRYFRHDRSNPRDRLWYEEKRLMVGLRWNISDGVILEAGGGFAMDRRWFEGEDLEDTSTNRINIHDGPFVGLQFTARF